MRAAGRFFRWIIISVVMQVVLLAYFNFIYIPGRNNVRATMYELPEDKVENREIKIPLEAEKVRVSYNGSYAAYIIDGNLEIAGIENKRFKKVIKRSGEIFSHVRWLPDRDMLIYSLKSSDSSARYVEIATYDLDAGVERSYPKIEDLPKGSEVTSIELSPLTNIVYVKIKVGDSTSKVYKYNIMDNLKFVVTLDNNTVMKETFYSDNLVYQGQSYKIFVRNGRTNTSKTLAFKGKMVLLGVDSEDNIYAGELDKDNKVCKVYYGKHNAESVKSWKQVSLENPAASGKIFVTDEGSIMIEDEKEKYVYTVGSPGKTAYKGDIVEVLNDYLVTKEGKNLKLTVLKPDSEK